MLKDLLIQGVQYRHTEKMLSTWIEDRNQGHMPISLLLVQAKAHSIYEDLSEVQ